MESNEYFDEGEYLSDDIGRLIEILLRQWRLIAAATLACALAAGLFGFLQPKSYRATAMIASKLSRSDVSLGSTIETSSDEELITSRVIDQKTRMQSYLNLVSSPLIAQDVLEEISPQYPDAMLTVPRLSGMVEGEIAEGSDSILIKAISGDAQMSADIANAWAQAYVEQVNSIYGTQSDIEGYEAILEQLERTLREYLASQDELESHISTRETKEISRQIAEITLMIDSLTGARNSVLNERVSSMKFSLAELYDTRRRVENYLENAEDMRSQVEAGGDGAAISNVIALNLLKTEAFGKGYQVVGAEEMFLESGSDLVIQTDLITTTADAMNKDLDGLIFVLENRIQSIDSSIEELSIEMLEISNDLSTTLDIGSSSLNDYDSNKLVDLEKKLSKLEANLEKEQAIGRELTQKRDLAWESYKNLQIKAAELGVSLGIKTATLVFAAPAIAPRGDISSTAKNVLIAAVVGFMFGVSAAFATEFWWRYKDIEPYPLLTRRRKEQAA
jgi:uncharacterized protein involved in exopolysaccharide biosynthesis